MTTTRAADQSEPVEIETTEAEEAEATDADMAAVTRIGVSVVRVRDTATGHHITITSDLADSDKARYKPLKSPAVDANGNPAHPKFKTNI